MMINCYLTQRSGKNTFCDLIHNLCNTFVILFLIVLCWYSRISNKMCTHNNVKMIITCLNVFFWTMNSGWK